MVQIKPFAVEQWMDAYETTAKYNIAETCSASISIDDLRAFSDDKTTDPIPSSAKLTYGAIRGTPKLRRNVANQYALSLTETTAKDDNNTTTPSLLPSENVLVTPGGIQANFLFLYTLVSRGDHIVCQYPTYQQLYSVPESLGAEVSLWQTRKEDDWQLHAEDLKDLLKENTKLIILNNPQNPTGAVTSRKTLTSIIQIAKERSIFVLADEAYRPLFHSLTQEETPPSLLSLGYERTAVTGGMSKAHGLAGIRVGWIASRSKALIEECAAARDYTTISVSQVDEQIASFALDVSCAPNLLRRNSELARRNLDILATFIAEHSDSCDWFRPRASTTAFVRFSRQGRPVDDVELCKALLDKKGVFFVPGSLSFGDEFKGFVRVGYVCETEVLRAGLDELRAFMRDGFSDVPLA